MVKTMVKTRANTMAKIRAKILANRLTDYTLVSLFLFLFLLIALVPSKQTSAQTSAQTRAQTGEGQNIEQDKPREELDTHSSLVDARLQNLYRRVRCPVCAGQPISESEAPLSRILREELAKKIEAGESDEEALAWLTARYGEGVLLRPRFSSAALLWLAPIFLAVASFLVLRARTRRGQ